MDLSDKYLRIICFCLSDRLHHMDWRDFSNLDWQIFTYTAYRQGVAPLLYWIIKTDCLDDFPLYVTECLKRAYYRTLAKNSLIFQEYSRITQALADAGIVWIALKGADVALSVYPNIGLRPMSDLDILVKADEFIRARAVILSCGYQEQAVQSVVLNRQIGHHRHYVHHAYPGIKLELHWGIVACESTYIVAPMEWFWENVLPANNALLDFENRSKVQCFRLAPTAYLLYAAGHIGFQHGVFDSPLIWLYDLHLLFHGYGSEINWDTLIDRAVRSRWNYALFTVLQILVDIFQTPVPQNTLMSLVREPDPVQVRLVTAKMVSLSGWQRKWYTLLSLGRVQQVQFIMAEFFPDREYLEQSTCNQNKFWPLLYLYYWKYILKRSLKKVSGFLD